MFHRISHFGIPLYGLAAVALGIIGIRWRDFATVWQPVPATLPHRAEVASFVALCLLAAGIATLFRKTAPI